jgi:hypothetical protein
MESNAPWTIIERAHTDGIAWRCTEVRNVGKQETEGKHRVIVSVTVDNTEVTDGSVNILWGWDDRQPAQAVPAKGPKNLDHNSIQIQPGQRIWVKIVDAGGFPSDTVHNLHCMGSLMGNDDAPFGYMVRFQLQRGEYVEPPIPVPELTLESLDARLRVVEAFMMGTKILH